VCFVYLDMKIYLKIEGVIGASKAAGYEGWLECGSVQWGVGRGIASPMPDQPRDVSEPSVSEITVTRAGDAVSARLAELATIGKPTVAELRVMDAPAKGEQDVTVAVYRIRNMLISGFSQCCGVDRYGGGQVGLSESISLNFDGIEVETFAVDGSGRSSRCVFDLVESARRRRERE
jgi:type VI secretion system secreted protein Hcp